MAKTLFDRIWEGHVVHEEPGEPAILYVDLHLVHEVTSPQAFEGLRLAGRRVRRPDLTVATMDHNVPTDGGPDHRPAREGRSSRRCGATARSSASRSTRPAPAARASSTSSAPSSALTQPGMTIVCGDSHTSTHGAFGALAFGIGTSRGRARPGHADACRSAKPKTMRITFSGELLAGRDGQGLILGAIGQIGVAGGPGHVIEYAGEPIRALSMEDRMTVCNMSIEAGARAGHDRAGRHDVRLPGGPARRAAGRGWERALERLARAAHRRRRRLRPRGRGRRRRSSRRRSPGGRTRAWSRRSPAVSRSGRLRRSRRARAAVERALAYMELEPGTPIQDIAIDRVFIGSCTNARIEDLRAAAEVVARAQGRPSVRALVVPGSRRSSSRRRPRASTGSSRDAGFEWREAGCSMCLGMNADVLRPGERCASTSNRNFEGRQGRGGRTHLVSPAMAAAAAIAGHFVDVRETSAA